MVFIDRWSLCTGCRYSRFDCISKYIPFSFFFSHTGKKNIPMKVARKEKKQAVLIDKTKRKRGKREEKPSAGDTTSGVDEMGSPEKEKKTRKKKERSKDKAESKDRKKKKGSKAVKEKKKAKRKHTSEEDGEMSGSQRKRKRDSPRKKSSRSEVSDFDGLEASVAGSNMAFGSSDRLFGSSDDEEISPRKRGRGRSAKRSTIPGKKSSSASSIFDEDIPSRRSDASSK